MVKLLVNNVVLIVQTAVGFVKRVVGLMKLLPQPTNLIDEARGQKRHAPPPPMRAETALFRFRLALIRTGPRAAPSWIFPQNVLLSARFT